MINDCYQNDRAALYKSKVNLQVGGNIISKQVSVDYMMHFSGALCLLKVNFLIKRRRFDGSDQLLINDQKMAGPYKSKVDLHCAS